MPKRFKGLWEQKQAPKNRGRPAASAEADSESGNEGAGSGEKDLYALDVMRERGLIGEDEYLRRRAKIASASD